MSATSKQTFLDNLLFDTLQPVKPVVPSALYKVHSTCFTCSKLSSQPESTLRQWGSPIRNSISSSCPFGFLLKIPSAADFIALPDRLHSVRKKENQKIFSKYVLLLNSGVTFRPKKALGSNLRLFKFPDTTRMQAVQVFAHRNYMF